MPVGSKKVLSIRLYDTDRTKLEFVAGYLGLNISDTISFLIAEKDKAILLSAKKKKNK
jgi:hypothetical protein